MISALHARTCAHHYTPTHPYTFASDPHAHRTRPRSLQADVVRLELLLQFGGLYIDMDVLLLRPLDDLIGLAALDAVSSGAHVAAAAAARDGGVGATVEATVPGGGAPAARGVLTAEGWGPELVLAQEGVGGSIGLGNAMMLAQQNSSMLRLWYDKYRDFSDRIWNDFSVRLPSRIAAEQPLTPSQLGVLPYDSAYWPPWNPWGLAQLYRTPRCMLPEARAVHLWETKMWRPLLGELTPERVRKQDSCFMRLAAAVLDGSYNFSAALLGPTEVAEDEQRVLYSSSLLAQWSPAEAKKLPPAAAASGGGDANDARPTAFAALLAGRSGSSSCVNLAGETCTGWAQLGECSKNAQFMHEQCARSCGLCSP